MRMYQGRFSCKSEKAVVATSVGEEKVKMVRLLTLNGIVVSSI